MHASFCDVHLNVSNPSTDDIAQDFYVNVDSPPNLNIN